jgi:hypothetical protein
MADQEELGTTEQFVIAKGFSQAGRCPALIGFDGTKRLFAELFADADRPDVRAEEAYRELFYSLQPGWTIRILQIFWPDPQPRTAFLLGVEKWINHKAEALDILHAGLLLAIHETMLPSLRRTFIEFILPGDEGLAWWEGLTGVCTAFGVQVKYLNAEEIQELAYRIMNPGFEL